MAIARNGDVELYYETFGDPADPTLLLVNGLGSQCINFPAEWCEMFVAHGYQVVRFDNRDVGLSSKLEGVDYALADMASDALAVLDAIGVDRAHVMGLSMGGMIVQRLAIDHADRLLSMTSVMSRTGEPEYGQSSPEALAVLTAKPAQSRRGVHRQPRGGDRHLRLRSGVARRGRPAGAGGGRLRPVLLPSRRRPPDAGRVRRPAAGRCPARGAAARAGHPWQP